MISVFIFLISLSCCGKLAFVSNDKGKSLPEEIYELSSQFERGQEAGNQSVYLYVKWELEKMEGNSSSCLDMLSSQLSTDGSTTLHLLARKDNAQAFRFVLEHAIKNFRPEVGRLLHQTDKVGKSVIALSFAAAPLCLAQLAELAGSASDLIDVDTLEKQVNARLFNEERGEYFDFNVLSSLLKIPSLVTFSYIPNRVELCFRNIEFLRDLMGEKRFCQCFMRKTKDLYKLLYTFLSFSDAMVDGVCAEKYFFDNFVRCVLQQDLYEATLEFKENLFDRVILNRNWNMLDFLLERLAGLLKNDDHFCIKRRVEWAAAKESGLKKELGEIRGDVEFMNLNCYFSEKGIWNTLGIESHNETAPDWAEWGLRTLHEEAGVLGEVEQEGLEGKISPADSSFVSGGEEAEPLEELRSEVREIRRIVTDLIRDIHPQKEQEVKNASYESEREEHAYIAEVVELEQGISPIKVPLSLPLTPKQSPRPVVSFLPYRTTHIMSSSTDVEDLQIPRPLDTRRAKETII